MYRALSIAILIGVSILFGGTTARSQLEKGSASEKREARLAWEALVKAKGGRERLESISTILITSFQTIKGKTVPTQYKLMALPHLVWKAHRANGEVSVYRSDSSKPMQQWAGTHGVSDWNNNDPSHEFAIDRLIYLLETRYEKPVPQKVSRGKIGKKTYDVIETIFDKERIDYYYEPEEMRVSQVVLYYNDGSIWRKYEPANYTSVNGIWMPQTLTVNVNDGQAQYINQVEFQFNVDYALDLFTGPLKATTLDAWKKRESK